MLERTLRRLASRALRKGAAERSMPWIAIGVAAHLFRRALREEEPVKKVRVRAGETVSVSVRERDD